MRIMSFVFENKSLWIVGILTSLVEGLACPIIGIFMAEITAAEIQYNLDQAYYSDRIRIYCLVVLAIGFAGGFTAFLTHIIYSILGESAIRTIRSQAFNKILNMPIDWFDKR